MRHAAFYHSSIVHSYVNSPSVKHHLQYFSFSPPSRFVPITQSSVSGMPQLWHTSVCGFPRSVLIETRNSFEMRCNVSRFGVVSPRSHRETACRVTNSRCAISFWESPSLWRSAEKICENAMLPPPDASIIEAGRSAVKQRAVSPSPYAGLKAASPNSGYARACRFIKRNTAPLNALTCKASFCTAHPRFALCGCKQRPACSAPQGAISADVALPPGPTCVIPLMDRYLSFVTCSLCKKFPLAS